MQVVRNTSDVTHKRAPDVSLNPGFAAAPTRCRIDIIVKKTPRRACSPRMTTIFCMLKLNT